MSVKHNPQVISHLEVVEVRGVAYTRCMISPVGDNNEILMKYSGSLTAPSEEFPKLLMKVLNERMWG